MTPTYFATSNGTNVIVHTRINNGIETRYNDEFSLPWDDAVLLAQKLIAAAEISRNTVMVSKRALLETKRQQMETLKTDIAILEKEILSVDQTKPKEDAQ